MSTRDEHKESPETADVPTIAEREGATNIVPGDIETKAIEPVGTNHPVDKIESQHAKPSPDETYCFLSKTLLVKRKGNSKDLPRPTKWLITAIVSTCGAAAPLGSTILMPALKYIAQDFSTSKTKTNLSIAFYALAVAITPLWWSAFSETYGRRPVYLVSFLLLIIFNALSAISTSIDMFIVMRCLSGGASACVQSVGAGTVADLWEVKERGRAMGMFQLGPVLGPIIAPIIGGAITAPLGWRSTQWALVIYAGLLWLAMIFLLPETSMRKRVPKTSFEETPPRSSAERLLGNSKSILSSIIAPIKVIPLFRFMPITLTVYYAGITFSSYYFINIAVQATFSVSPYHFRAVEVGLMYIPSALGAGIAGVFGGKWMDYIMRRNAAAANRYDEDGNLDFRPQDRIGENAYIAGVMYPLGMLLFGWTSRFYVFWFVPCVANFFFGAGQMLIFNLATTMLTEFVPKRTSTGVALNNLVRNSLACIAAIITQPLINTIGDGWLFTLVCLICLPSVAILLILQRKAEGWRAKMTVELDKL